MAKRMCQTCGTPLSNRSKRDHCRSCLSVCHCGKPKDYRAAECISCGMSRKAKAQWADPTTGQKIREGIALGSKNRRTRLEDLGKRKWQRKLDGRLYNWYWPEGGNRKRTIYRYQWIWVMEHGSIPAGHVLHHLNRDPTDDRLENLELMTVHDHCKLHGAIAKSNSKKPWWTCLSCGTRFQKYRRSKNVGRKYCSVSCYRRAQRSTTSL